MERLIAIERESDIPAAYRGNPVGDLLRFHNLGVEGGEYERAELLVGMCMDHRKRLRMPERFAYVVRTGGGNLRFSEFKVSFAIAVGGVRAIALVAHSQCGMAGVTGRREQFVRGLVEGAGWSAEQAEQQFDEFAPRFEIGNEIDFVLSEARRLRERYPKVAVGALYYRVEDNRLYALRGDG